MFPKQSSLHWILYFSFIYSFFSSCIFSDFIFTLVNRFIFFFDIGKSPFQFGIIDLISIHGFNNLFVLGGYGYGGGIWLSISADTIIHFNIILIKAVKWFCVVYRLESAIYKLSFHFHSGFFCAVHLIAIYQRIECT